MSQNEKPSKQVLLRLDADFYDQIVQSLSETGNKTVQDFFRRAGAAQLSEMRASTVSIQDALDLIAGEVDKVTSYMLRIDQAMKLLASGIASDNSADPIDLMTELSDTLTPPKPPSSVYGNCNFVLVNTNIKSGSWFEDDMIRNSKASAYYMPWQRLIQNNIRKGDWVFLYRSGVGIVAFGRAMSDPENKRFDGDPEEGENETFVSLNHFVDLTENPVDLKTIRLWSGYQLNPRRTVVTFEVNAGASLLSHIEMMVQQMENEAS